MCQFTPYYDPYIGRFISEDSYWGEDVNPLSLNLYTYCSNDPIQFTDPTGHWQQGDEKLSKSAQDTIKQATDAWNKANASKDEAGKAAAHAMAEAARRGDFSTSSTTSSSKPSGSSSSSSSGSVGSTSSRSSNSNTGTTSSNSGTSNWDSTGHTSVTMFWEGYTQTVDSSQVSKLQGQGWSVVTSSNIQGCLAVINQLAGNSHSSSSDSSGRSSGGSGSSGNSNSSNGSSKKQQEFAKSLFSDLLTSLSQTLLPSPPEPNTEKSTFNIKSDKSSSINNNVGNLFSGSDNQILFVRYDESTSNSIIGLSVDKQKIRKDASIDIRERLDRILHEQHQFLIFGETWSYYETSFAKKYTDNYNRAVSDYGGWLAMGFGAEWMKNSLEYLQVAALLPEAYVNPYLTVGGSLAIGFYQAIADPQPGFNNFFSEHDLLGFGKKALNATVEKVSVDKSAYKYFLQGENNNYRKGFINELGTLKNDILKQDIVYGNDKDNEVYKQTMIDYIDNVVKINNNYKESEKEMEDMLKRQVKGYCRPHLFFNSQRVSRAASSLAAV